MRPQSLESASSRRVRVIQDGCADHWRIIVLIAEMTVVFSFRIVKCLQTALVNSPLLSSRVGEYARRRLRARNGWFLVANDSSQGVAGGAGVVAKT
jgi:hypothetical protein